MCSFGVFAEITDIVVFLERTISIGGSTEVFQLPLCLREVPRCVWLLLFFKGDVQFTEAHMKQKATLRTSKEGR